MLVQCVVLLFISVSGLSCDDGTTDTDPTVSVTQGNENTFVASEEAGPSEAIVDAGTSLADSPVTPVVAGSEPASTSRPWRRRRARYRGYYDDNRYRNRDNNPHNPNSPYSFRGRPPQAQPPVAAGQYYDPRYNTGYDNQYYDPYSQSYYGYPGYVQSGYYGYPYQPQQPEPYPPPPNPPQPPMPQTPPATEHIPDLYYVRKSPDGQYQYKKVSVVQGGYESRRRRGMRGTRWPQQAQQLQPGYPNQPQTYYGQYDSYNRRPQPPPQQPYYPQPEYTYPQAPQNLSPYQQQLQYAQSYSYHRAPGGSRSHYRSGRALYRSTPTMHSWRLTTAGSALYDKTHPPLTEAPVTRPEQFTEPSGG